MADDDRPTQQQALKNLREGIERSSRLVEQLLALSKLESGNASGEDEELNWELLIGNAIEEQQSSAKLKNIAFTTDIKKYSGKGADITLEITEKALTCRNNKVKIEKEHLARLGERFFRPAGQKAQGSGLGLSIVEKIAALHNCCVAYNADDDVFSVIITKK